MPATLPLRWLLILGGAFLLHALGCAPQSTPMPPLESPDTTSSAPATTQTGESTAVSATTPEATAVPESTAIPAAAATTEPIAALVAAEPAAAPPAPPVILPASTYRPRGTPVRPRGDGAILCEAEEFAIDSPGWQAKPYGENYYAATFANTFLSRKAFLAAPAVCPESRASIEVEVPAETEYAVLVRYEAAYRFETQFRLVVEQAGEVKLDRLYGARANPKIWAFKEGVKPEVAWSWGAVENIVWEGHEASVKLGPGRAKITLVTVQQPDPPAQRHVDLVMLVQDRAEFARRLAKENFLPGDGLLTQEGDVFLKVKNLSGDATLKLAVPKCTEHSPYWVHDRTWKPLAITVEASQTSEWIDVGGLLDTLSDGSWQLTAMATPIEKAKPATLHYELEFGVKTAAGEIESIRTFSGRSPAISLAFAADTRYSRRIRRLDEVAIELVQALEAQPVAGHPPRATLVYATVFPQRGDSAEYTAARTKFLEMFGITEPQFLPTDPPGRPRGYVDLRGRSVKQLEEFVAQQKASGNTEKIAVVSLGDEIGLAKPRAIDQAEFRKWLETSGVTPSDLAPGANDLAAAEADVSDRAIARKRYYTKRYERDYGIQQLKTLSAPLIAGLPNAGVGANFSPHHHHAYLGDVTQWVTLFQQGALTMPWSEDYIWQVPVGSQQMNFISLDLFRAGVRNHPQAKIHYYVMPHTPGNTPASWRRQFYGDLGHGMQIVNLFEFRPVELAYTENHSSSLAMYQEVRKSLYELAVFEDLIQAGHVANAETGLWTSEVSDIWDDQAGSFAAGKRSLYLALKHQGLLLDFITEPDALGGVLAGYKLLYITDTHVTRAASAAIRTWVEGGGKLVLTAGAGSRDEFDEPNEILLELAGCRAVAIDAPEAATVRLEKQDLPFAEVLDTVTFRPRRGDQPEDALPTIPVYALRAVLELEGGIWSATFQDGKPAIAYRKAGQGEVHTWAFLPGLSYLQQAIPKRPVDRGTTDEAMAHFIPTDFHAATRELIERSADKVPRPIVCTEPLVEASLVRAEQGVVIPLVNWSGRPQQRLTVFVNVPLPEKVTLASGGAVEVTPNGKSWKLVLDLDIADAIIARP